MSGIINNWERSSRGQKATRLRALYEFVATHLYDQYEPNKRVSEQSALFLERIESWLASFQSDADRWNAFRSLEYFLFLGVEEYEELYRCACDHTVLPWICDLEGIDIFGPATAKKIEKALKKTWICPVTDSLRINSFLHLTGLPGLKFRPDWHSLSKFGDGEKIANYVCRSGIGHLVLVEDYVGTGTQFGRALEFAVENFNGPILALPLVVCAPGDEALRGIEARTGGRVTYKPGVVIPKNCLVGQAFQAGEPVLFKELRDTLLAAFKIMGEPRLDGEEYGFGYVGSLVCTFSNCPNNTPPIYHYSDKRWNAIFPRAGRRA